MPSCARPLNLGTFLCQTDEECEMIKFWVVCATTAIFLYLFLALNAVVIWPEHVFQNHWLTEQICTMRISLAKYKFIFH